MKNPGSTLLDSRETPRVLHRLFRMGLILKSLDGLLETVGGLLLLLFHQTTFNHLVVLLTQHELAEDPKDFVANKLRALATHLNGDAKFFAVAYLLVHGIVKIVLAYNLLRERSWVYPWAMGFFLVFMAYELYRLSYTHSPALAAFFSLDLAIVALLQWEHGCAARAKHGIGP